MKTIEQLNAEHAANLAKLEAEHNIAARALIQPDRCMVVKLSEKAWLTYKVESLWQAIAVMQKFEPLPFNEYKGTFTRFEPEPVNREGECKSGPYIAQIRVHHGEGFGPCVKMFFFVQLGEDICKVICDLQRGYDSTFWQYGAHFVANDRGRKRQLNGKRYIAGDYIANRQLSAMMDKVTTWGTGCDKSAEHSYSIMADNESGDWLDARLRLENLASLMHGDKPEQ